MASRARRAVQESQPVAVLDIGSNSGRVVVYQPEAGGHLRLVAGARAPLGLVRELDATGALGEAAIARTLEVVSDFRAVAVGGGARRIVALATAAVREAADGPELIARVKRELRIDVEILDGPTEARYAFDGAIRGLPTDSGVLFDMGGGSMQLVRFREREVQETTSLPLGALRLSERFLRSDPPKKWERRALREHVLARLAEARVPPLGPSERLVGTGGSCRNLAKVDRRPRGYPATRLHGYRLSRHRVAELATLLTGRRRRRRGSIPGLSRQRGDSIAGGAVGILALLDHLGADDILVAGQGVREGAAYGLLHRAQPSIDQSRERSLRALCERFATWTASRAERRVELVTALSAAVQPRPSQEVRELLAPAARLLDIGVSVDYFDRHEHAADIVLATDLEGFTHRQVALLSAIVRSASSDPEPFSYGSLMTAADKLDVRRGGVLLALADDIEERCAPRRRLRVRATVEQGTLRVVVTGLLGWLRRGLEQRFARAFDLSLSVEPL